MEYKTQPLKHQAYYLDNFAGREYFAVLCEQGTGKSWMLINEIAELWGAEQIDGVLIFAPNGVHENWTRPNVGQISQHMPDSVEFDALAWNSIRAKWAEKERDEFFSNGKEKLKIYAFNWEAIQNQRGQNEVLKFIGTGRRLFVILDESDAIKDPTGLRAKFLEKAQKSGQFKFRRIATGTPINNAPFDAFSQFKFLHPSILGTSSYRAFKTEYSKTLPPNHGLIKGMVTKKIKLSVTEMQDVGRFFDCLLSILAKNKRYELIERGMSAQGAYGSQMYDMAIERLTDLENMFDPNSNSTAKLQAINYINGIRTILGRHDKMIKAALNPNRIPLIVDKEKDPITGATRPAYRNLEKLNRIIAPHSYRVLRSECLDLPDKIYETSFFYLTEKQAEIYRKAESEYRLEFEGIETPFSRLTIAQKLAQITSGYYLFPGEEEPIRISGENPKLKLLAERIQKLVEQGKQAIIWARYTTEILDVSRALDELGIPNAKYHGETKRGERLDIIDDFQSGKLKVFIGNQRAGGTGITLTAASSVHYYSNSFSYRDRVQSEDRAMRIGQDKDVTYYNYAGIGTVDEYVISCLLNKQNVSFEIVDKGRDDLFNLGDKLKTA